MIVWLNGAFGVGKTSTARELVSLMPRSRTFNPERLGWVLQRTAGRRQPGDFQHLAAWRRGTVRLVSLATRPNLTVVVPMSVLRTAYLDELLVGLRERGHDVHHVLLDTSVDALHARITSDQAAASAAGWRRRHVDLSQEARSSLAARGITLDTTRANTVDVASTIAAWLPRRRRP